VAVKRALVCGSEGFIGYNLVAHLKKLGVEVVRYDLYLGQDICDESQLREYMSSVDVAYNCAAISNIIECDRDREKCRTVNYEGTNTFVRVALELKVKPVLLSTDIIWGDSYYGALKKLMEAEHQENAVILRLTNIIGGLRYEDKHNVLWHFLRDNPIRVHADATTVDLVPIEQALEEMVNAENYSPGIYNVESGLKIPVRLLAFIFGASRGVPVEVVES